MPADILQLRSSTAVSPSPDFAQNIDDGLSRPIGQKELPTILLYDERGLRLYDDITTGAPEYYLFGAEEQILKDHADDIVKIMHGSTNEIVSDEVVLELGAGYVILYLDGNLSPSSALVFLLPILLTVRLLITLTRSLRKTSHILAALSHLTNEQTSAVPITYYALDLEQRELERTLGEIQNSQLGELLRGKVKTRGMCGTYDDGLKYLSEGGLYNLRTAELVDMTERAASPKRSMSPGSNGSSGSESQNTLITDSTPPSSPGVSPAPLHIMFLGSSLGNFPRPDAIEFLRSLPLRPGFGDTLLLGLDHDNDPTLIEEAYNDSRGYTRDFIMNGLRAAGRILGDEKLFEEQNWEYINCYNTVRPPIISSHLV